MMMNWSFKFILRMPSYSLGVFAIVIYFSSLGFASDPIIPLEKPLSKHGFSLPFVAIAHKYGWEFARDPDDFETPFSYPLREKTKIDHHMLGECFAIAGRGGKHPLPNINADEYFCQDIASGELIADKSKCGSILDYLVFRGSLSEEQKKGSSKYAMVTGNEQALRKWIEEQPVNSISPYRFFQESLRLNHGNVWNALITNYQVLRPAARWYDKERYGNHWSKTEAKLLFNKFIDIRGDLWEACPGQLHGDHQGSWYRMWGAMLFQLSLFDKLGVETKKETMMCVQPKLSLAPIQKFFGKIGSAVAFFGDEYIEKPTEADLGKFGFDLSMAKTAHSLYDFITDSKAEIHDLQYRTELEKHCKADRYLVRSQTTWDDITNPRPINYSTCKKLVNGVLQ